MKSIFILNPFFMTQVFPHRLGRTLSLFAGLVHLVWAILIWLGWASPLLAFIYRMHSIQMEIGVLAMPIGRAIGLVIITLALGYAVGFVIGTIWEKVK